MKKLLLLFIVTFCALSSTAQIRVAKINLLGASVGSLGLSFEHVRKKQYSFQINASYRIPIGGPSILYKSLTTNWNVESTKTSGFAFGAEYRFYTRKARTQPAKPYTGIFAHYGVTSGEANFSADNTTYDLQTSWSRATIGFQYGIQYVIQDVVSLDFNFIGFGFSYQTINGTAKTTGDNPKIGLLEEDLLKVPLVGSRLLLDGKNGQYDIEDKFFTLGMRISIGFGVLF